MGYNNDGGGYCGPGFGNMFGFGGMGLEALLFLLFFGMWGGGMWGGGFGGFGGRGIEQATTTAAETAALVGQQQVADRVASINTGVAAVNGIATANGVKIETVKDAVNAGFSRMQTDLCSSFNNAAMQAVNNHNNLTSQLTDMRFAQQQCCCDTKQLIQSSFCDLRHQMAMDKCDTDGKIAASTASVIAQLNNDRYERMQEKLDKANSIIAAQQAAIDNRNQTDELRAEIRANGCARPAAPAWPVAAAWPTPCAGPAYPYGGAPCTPCNPCGDGVQRAVNNALSERIGELLFPTTAPATT